MLRSFSRISTVFVLAIIVGIFAGCGRPDPADTVRRFTTALEERRYEDAVKCMTKSARDTLDTTDPQTGVSRRAALYNELDETTTDAVHIKKFVVLDEQINGNRATVTLEAHLENGKVEKMKPNLVWEDGAWRILTM